MTETRRPDGSDLDNRHRFDARAHHAGDSPTAVCTADIRALACSLRSGLQARVHQAWICYRKASARGSSEIAARSPGMVVVGAVVAPTRARAFPRGRSGMALVDPTDPSRDDQRKGDDRRNAPQRARRADSGRSRDRDQTAQFIGLRMSLKPIDLYQDAEKSSLSSRYGV
jgi:hypothetical protein